jgi:uncharacterized phiE125 gp8 family phage protein
VLSYAWYTETGPAVEPLSLADAKLHLSIGADETEWDGYIPGLITAARVFTEERTGLAAINQAVVLILDRFPDVIFLPRGPVSAVATVKYVDDGGTQRTLAESLYQKDLKSKPARITPAFGCTWPSTREQMSAVEVKFTAGYGTAAASVDARFIQAMKLLLSHWFENRDAVGTVGENIALSYNALCRSIKLEPRKMD